MVQCISNETDPSFDKFSHFYGNFFSWKWAKMSHLASGWMYVSYPFSFIGSVLPLGFRGGSADKKILLKCRRPGFDLWLGKIPWRRESLPTPDTWRREWLPTPEFRPGELHGLYSPWVLKESCITEWLSLSFIWTQLKWLTLALV